MTYSSRVDVSYEYYRWLLEKLRVREENKLDYSLLLKKLYKTDFEWSVKNDDNRAGDGLELREEFCDEELGCSYDFNRPCSVLEMLIALSIRCEVDIMGEPGEDHPSRWFWIMIDNLGLTICTDENYWEAYVEQQLDIWMRRKFKRNGKGGLFPLKGHCPDQRKVEIWFQMCNFLNENFSFVK